MRHIKKEPKKVEVVKQVVVEDRTTCDICNKDIPGGHWRIHRMTPGSDAPFTGKDVCSKKCIDHELNDYIKKSEEDKKGGALFEILYVPTREVETDHE